jgi:KipI family sensor histidine kinase inhibitor
MRPDVSYPRFLPVGDGALSVEFGDAISPALNDRVIALDIALAAAELPGIVETIPSYRSLLICYDPMELAHRQIVAEIGRLLSGRGAPRPGTSAAWSVPVIYDPPFAEDLPEVANRLGVTPEQVIAIHTGWEFQVYTVGFAPGLPYLGELPPALHISRRETPRPAVPAGAVLIGGIQATIVPVPVPSGWYQLGQTPLRPFDLQRKDPFLFRPGDRIRFRQVNRGEYDHLMGLDRDDLLASVRTLA